MDPFEVLGVSRTASPEVIRAAYRALAKEFHPDRASGNNGRMAELNAAYEILNSEEKRAYYLKNEAPHIEPHHKPAAAIQRTIYKSREWQVAATAFPAITDLYLQLERIHPTLAERFAQSLLAEKKFEMLDYKSSRIRFDFLRENFGHDWRLQELGKYLLIGQMLDDVDRLKEMLSVLGDSPNNRDVILSSFEPHTSAVRAALSASRQTNWSKTPPTPTKFHLDYVAPLWFFVALFLLVLVILIK